MSTKILIYPSRNKIREIKNLISKYWVTKSKKKHILIRNNQVFNWLYLLKKNKYSFFYTEAKKKCNGFLGFVQNSKFSNKLKKNDILWLSMWLSDIKFSKDKNFTGLKIILFFINYFKKKTIATIGCNDKTKELYHKLGFRVGSLSHAYILNPNISKFKIAKIKTNTQKKIKLISPNYQILDSIKNLQNSKFDKNFSKIFNKNIEYFINKYEKNIFYSYKFLVLRKKKKIKFFIVYKKIYLKGKIVIRFIDFYGDFKYLPELENSIMNFFIDKKLEYIDFYYYGIPNKYLLKTGFKIKKNNSNIILPNYFEPFFRENININYAIKEKSFKHNQFLFKGDCDQERPN